MAWMRSSRKFFQALNNGDEKTVRDYIKNNSEWLAVEHDSLTPLVMCIKRNNSSMIRLLIELGVDVNATNYKDETPLMVASMLEREYAVQLLMEAGANVDAEDYDEKTALKYCIDNNNSEIAEILLSHNASYDHYLIMDAAEQAPDVACSLFDHGANPDQQDRKGITPLMHASQDNEYALALNIVNTSCPLNRQANDGDTALHCAVVGDNADIVKLLLTKGLDPTIKNHQGQTAYELARDKKMTQIARILKPKTIPQEKPVKQPEAKWIKMGDHMIARVGTYKQIGQKLTEIFNFESAERIIVIEDLKTNNICTSAPSPFRVIEGDVVNHAAEAFIAQKGDPKICTGLTAQKVRKL